MVRLISHDTNSRILEPSCGEGVFLRSLENNNYFNIDAYEIDRTLRNPYNYVRYTSFISSPMDRYDVVIGNPPYIRWKNLEPELKEELKISDLWSKYFNSLCDYLFIFILKSIEQLNEGGELIFICTEYWMNTTHSSSLREYMTRNGYISDIYHFKEATLFEGVCASFIIFRYVKSAQIPSTIRLHYYTKKGAPSLSMLCDGSCFDISSIPQFRNGERWLLATKEQQDILSKFENQCRKAPVSLFDQSMDIYRIGDFCDIGNGMVSGLDKAFNVSSVDDLNEYEQSCTINVLKAKDLDYYIEHSNSKYFFIKDRICEDDLKMQLPHIYKHIIPYKEELEARYDYGKDTKYWEFVFPRNLSLFMRKSKRILVPCKERVSNKKHFRFVLAGDDFFPLQDVTGIIPKTCCKESIEYLTAYLNNYRVFEWLTFNGITKGYIVEFSEAPISSIPYRPIDWDNPKEIEIHDRITMSVKNFIKTRDDKFLQIINNSFNSLIS